MHFKYIGFAFDSLCSRALCLSDNYVVVLDITESIGSVGFRRLND